MPVRELSQVSFFSPEFVDPTCVEPGSLTWLISKYAWLLFPAWLFKDWVGHGRRGRDAWPARVLMSTLLLRFLEGGMSRRAMARRLKTDIAWRAAAGLPIGGGSPDESIFRRFEWYLRRRDRASGRPRFLLLHEHILRVCIDADLINDRSIWVMDSTPMWCFGAVQDTVRLLGDGLRSLCGEWARLTKTSVTELAAEWDLPLLLAPSTKGGIKIDWRDRDARATAIDSVARDVLRVIGKVRRGLDGVRANKRKGLLRRCRALAKVIADDLEVDDEGRLFVARKTTSGRLVSITDLQARHGRKTRSVKFKGYRLHVLGDIVSGLIASVSVTPATVGDSAPAGRLIRRAQRVVSGLRQVLGDTAYGGAGLHLVTREVDGVDILAPPVPVSRRSTGRFNSTHFDIDVPGREATCPAGITVELRQTEKSRRFSWSKVTCDACPLRAQCLTEKASSKTLPVNENHEELLIIRERWADVEIRTQYRLRTQGERLVNQVVRYGGRKAMAWGLSTAVLQANLIAIRSNLGMLARHLANNLELQESIAKEGGPSAPGPVRLVA